MKQGAGFLLICPSTKRILLALRNEGEPTWANFGGSVEKFEAPLQCAKRELVEEAGFLEGQHYHLTSKRPIDISKYINFVYRCYLGIVEHEMDPVLNYEHTTFQWFSLDEIPSNRHFGLKRILSNTKVRNKIDKYFA
jgi:8-oxo-dGTP pyrophosphatase MutT (NUDIX family)